jgi:hypothetical protein
MRRLALGITIFALVAAGPSAADAYPLVYKDRPLVYKALPPTRSVPKPNAIHLPNPPKENDLFRRFLEWLRTQQSLPAENSTAVRAGDNLSEKEREKLFTEFLEWRSRHPGE